MYTLFECWNGGRTYVQNNVPYFIFDYPPHSPELVTFFLLSARVSEVMNRVETGLVLAGQVLDVPNLPEQEIRNWVDVIRIRMGYQMIPWTTMVQTNMGTFVQMHITSWVNLSTGRADCFNPASGLVMGPSIHQTPQHYAPPVDYRQFSISMNQDGRIQGQGVKNSWSQFVNIAKDVGSVAHAAGQVLDFFQNIDTSTDWY